jgi:hypothetical protein|tara:strand:+ start:5855 stop:6151 length:297 start_codon:yes stop_codon:yes gene_type:complete
MALKTIEDLCTVDAVGGTIVVSSDAEESTAAHAELGSMEARNLAIKTAASLGLPDPRISGSVDIFSINAKTGEELEGLVPSDTSLEFRASIPVTQRLV